MRKAILVAQQEYLENVKRKGFWIGIMILPVIYSLMFLVPNWLENKKPAQNYTVIDRSGWLLSSVNTKIRTEDLADIFENTAQRIREEEDQAVLPKVLVPLARFLPELDPSQLHACAVFTAAPDSVSPDSLPPLVRDILPLHSQAITAWWGGGPGEEWAALVQGTSRNRFRQIPITPDKTPDDLNKMVTNGDIFAYFVIGPDPISGDEGSKYVSTNLTDNDLLRWFKTRASSQVRLRRLEKENIDPDIAGWIQQPLYFEGRKISETGQEEEVETRDMARQWAPVAFMYILWLSILSISQMLLTNTIEEKSNRLIEVLLSSMSPIQLMAGKILGIATTGLTMVGTWIAWTLVGAWALPALLGVTLDFDILAIAGDPLYLTMFFGYFAMGYLFYAAVLVGLGSVCNTLKEAQTLMAPVMMMLFIPLFTVVPIGQDPNGLLARILSYIPPLTPFVMMSRAAGPPSLLEYLLTSLLLLASILFALWSSAKVFRIGILLTGKPPKIREILKWIKAPVGLVPDRSEPTSQGK